MKRDLPAWLTDRSDQDVQSSTLRLVVFDIEGQRYAVPLNNVERVLPMVEVSPLPQAPAVVLGVMNLHGQVIPVIDLRRRLGLPLRDYGLTARLLMVRTSRRILALTADEVLGVRDVAQETITRPDALLPGIGHVAGIVSLADGLLFIHDVEACLSLNEEQRLTTALEELEN
ncbi:MAG: purine-binding chemotaxis protein CheW [candidate division NC10 bacterium]|nr:purine-binding chemotaxis protein CheW [candidate division NC10 bacterium]MDE2322663.1 purine-binding chemotaxis protein CheW [candidate division NC10 bacterium]